ncbi:LOW QUALITY PROTEIN: mucin-17-like [Macrobrachium rosenbergii]|uniref:LOW QUALITY PROTEIN: mucin-17-like n=1 Tax=Macrobrachium rosenbergii TaxID=79674 RepID=UPI0034D76E4D
MKLSLFIGLCFLTDLLGAQTWRKQKNPDVPPHGQKLGPLNSELPVVRFECAGRGGGYYGDMDFGCSIFHYCTADGTRYTFKCTKGLKFNEMTTSCSAGFFGDCSHPEIVGSAGRNMTAEPAPVKSFQNIPVFKGEDKSYVDDPRDYPEPFIQHYDPALDLNYDYYEEEDASPGLQDAQPSASNILPNKNYVQSDSIRNTGMESALSAFASLVNVPLDSSSNAKARIDRMDLEDPAEYVNNIDRAFVVRPPLHGSISERENLRQPLKYSNYKSGPKKIVGIGGFPGYSHNLIPVSPPPLYPMPPTENYLSNQNQFSINPSSKQFQNIIPYNSKDSHASQDESIHQTTPDTFRPSSLMTDNPEDFQPVSNSDNEQSEHKRPYRQAPHQSDHGLFSNFQTFSPTPGPFASTRFPQGHTAFGGPSSSQRGFETSGGFLPAPNFPSSGNFVFNQPPIHPAVFNAPFRSVSPQSGTVFSRPRPLTHTTSTFSNSPPEHHTHFIHHPHHLPPPRGHSFGPPPDEPTIFRPQSQQNDNTFIHSNSFINSPSHKPPSPPTVRNFIHHTTPSSIHTFASSPAQNTFSSDLLTRPTPASGFIQTPSPSQFNADHQNPFNFQHERPLLESFPNIVQSVESQTTDLPPLFSKEPVHHDFTFPISSTARPSLLINLEESDPQDTLSDERPKVQANLPPSLDPRPNRRRRPVASRQPVPVANQQPVPLTTARPVPFTTVRPVPFTTVRPVPFTTVRPVPFTTQQPLTFSKRPPSRTIRKNIANRVEDPNPTLVTGLEQSEFHSQFLQPDGKHPSSPKLQTDVVDTYTEFDDSQLREPDYQQSDDFISDIDSKNVDDSDIYYETEEESNNIVEHGNDYDDVTDTPTTSPAPISTTTQKPPVTFRGPILRRRPNLRNRVRTRLSSRDQTTPQPNQSDESINTNVDENSSDDPETNGASTLTTASPFRQRVQERLNRFKEQKQGTETSSTTTESPDEVNTKDSESGPDSESDTTAPRKPTGFRNTNSDRFQNYRNRLRNRLRNRTPRTTVAPTAPKSSNNQATSRPSSLLTGQRNRRISPLKSRREEKDESEDVDSESRDGDVTEELVNAEGKHTQDSADEVSLTEEATHEVPHTEEAAHEVPHTEEAAHEVPHTEEATHPNSEPNTDQQVQETSHSLIQKPPPPLEITSDFNPSDNSKSEDAVVLEKTEDEMPKNAEETGTGSTDLGKGSNDNLEENHDNLENNQKDTDPKRRRIINPNFRARFREFIKNRKNRLDTNDTTASPDSTGEGTEDQSDTKETPEVAQDENPNLSFKERMEHFNKNRENIRKRFLANRQTSEGERSGRRIPIRPLRNKLVDGNGKNNENQPAAEEVKSESTSPEAREELDNTSVNNNDSQVQNKRNSVIVNKVTDGFTPALSPIHVKSPLIEHLSLQGATTPVQETEIITAPPSARAEDSVATVKVSATLIGDSKPPLKNEEDSVTEKPEQMVEETGLSDGTNGEEKDFPPSTLELVEEKLKETQKNPANISSGTKDVPVLQTANHPGEQNLHTEPKKGYLPEDNNKQSENIAPTQSQPESKITYLPSSNAELQLPKDNENNSPGISGIDALPKEDTKDTNAGFTEKQSDPGKPQRTGDDQTGLSESPSNEEGQRTVSNAEVKTEENHNTGAIQEANPVTPMPKVTIESESTRVSKPTFDLSVVGNKNANSESSAISASDFSEEFSDNATPVSLLPITMSTDPPKLPLEMLLPLFRRR